MKQDKTIEKWFKERNDKELSILHTLIKDERIKNTFLFSAFRWTVNECDELHNLRVPISITDSSETISTKTKNETDSQIGCISRYRESGICVRCKNPFQVLLRKPIKRMSRMFILLITYFYPFTSFRGYVQIV